MSQATPQGDLFARTPDALAPHAALQPEALRLEARRRLNEMLTLIRAAGDVAPWPPHRIGVQTIVFYNMAEWLDEAERGPLREAFRRECRRLGIAPYPAG